jgi:CRP-like cAMP-binding protein
MVFDRTFLDEMAFDSKHRNSILQSLPGSDWNLLKADLKFVELQRDAVLFGSGPPARFAYFPSGSVISFLGDKGDGGSVEVWSVGTDGMAGLSSVFGRPEPFKGIVQVPGIAAVAKMSTVRRHFERGGSFQDALLRYYCRLLTQISHLGICNSNHSIEQRFSRWLLMVGERAGTDRLKFTQEAIAAVLGTRRASISVAAAELQSQGLISYSAGAITIESRRNLEKAACDCYKLIDGRKGY